MLLGAVAVAFCEEKTDFEERVTLLIKHAKLAEMKSDFREADTYYHRALRLVESSKEKNDELKLKMQIYVYDHMANLAMARGDFDAAEKLYKETMRGLLQQGANKHGQAMVELSLKLSMIYAIQGRDKEAENGYKFCIREQTKNTQHATSTKDSEKDATALLGMCHNSYARYLFLHKRFLDALVEMEKALLLAKESLGTNSAQVAVLYNDLGHIEFSRENYSEARIYKEEAVKIAEELELDELCEYYCNLGTVHIHLGNLQEARQYLERSLVLARTIKNKTVKKEAETWLGKCKEILNNTEGSKV